MELADTNLTLFFTGGVGLETWAEAGILSREVAIYQCLTEHLKSVNFVTYGGRADLQYTGQLGHIGLYPTLWNRPIQMCILRLLMRHWRMLMQSDVLKTNQILGSEIPVWCKRYFGKRLILRCGYLYAHFTEQKSRSERVIAAAYRLERTAFKAADIAVVATAHDSDWVVKTHGTPREKLRVIPNYVDVKIFSPSRSQNKASFDLAYVGRSDPQKNISALLEAIARLKRRNRMVALLMIGSCSGDSRLRDIVQMECLDVTFVGNIPNAQLPEYLNKATAFVLPSLYEGHPKVLLEAMSCSLPCIGTNVEGIREEISHRETGYLCYTDPQSIAEAIET
ncbi:glycosyltransferase family 4 protein, partial [bacterium]|nr:glycosyltransferase family 4 protein [bacterium]